MVLGNDSVQYRCETIQPPEPQVAQMYAEFADWSARLNAVNPPHLPAFMRLDLNSELADRKLMPKTIKKVTSYSRAEVCPDRQNLADMAS